VTDPLADAATNRRNFLGLIGLGAAAVAGGGLLAGCSEKAGSKGAATQADKGVLPTLKKMDLVKPDLPGEGPIPDGFLSYPSNLVDAITEKPGTGGQAIRTMAPWWGPTPPGLGRNSFLNAANTELGVQVNPSMQDGITYADKLSATLGARDVPDLLNAPNWEVDKIPRFSDAVSALFEDLTDYLKGDAVNAYPMLATLPTAAWEYCLWGGRLAAIPFPTDGAFAWMLFQRKDLLDAAGVAAPTTIDELYQAGKKMTNAGKGVWAFGTVFDMVQQFFGAPGSSQNGWRKKSGGGLEHKYETQEYRQALEFVVRLFKDGMIHPDVLSSKGADEKTLFNGGKIVLFQDGPGAWQGMQGEQVKVTPTFNMQPVRPFSAAGGGKPVLWGSEKPIFYTFVKKGLGKDRTEELLRVLNWCAAPFGTKEYELAAYGVEGKHFTRGPDGSPLPTDLGRKELAGQYTSLGGRVAAKVKSSDTPNYVQDYINYHKETIQYLEPDLFKGIKLELPANYSKVLQPTEDKIQDIRFGRRPLSDLDTIVKEFRSGGGDEGRAFLEKALADNGR
jgi:putative aldouronate transport system substrate-binding protein